MVAVQPQVGHQLFADADADADAVPVVLKSIGTEFRIFHRLLSEAFAKGRR